MPENNEKTFEDIFREENAKLKEQLSTTEDALNFIIMNGGASNAEIPS